MTFVGIYRGGTEPPNLTSAVYYPDGQVLRWGENVCGYGTMIDVNMAKWWPCWTPDPAWFPAQGRYAIRAVIGDGGGQTDSQVFDLLMPLALVRNAVLAPNPVTAGATVTADTYGHISLAQQKQAAARMDAILSAARSRIRDR